MDGGDLDMSSIEAVSLVSHLSYELSSKDQFVRFAKDSAAK